MLSKNQKQALDWIVGMLGRLDIPFHITGGLAAMAYGAERPLYDIDIDIPDARMPELAAATAPFITFGPCNFKDPKWDLAMMTLRYQDVPIDITGAESGKIYDEKNNRWMKYDSDMRHTEWKDIAGKTLPIISRDILIAYKKILARKEDNQDVQALS